MKPKSVGAVVDASTLRNRAGASEQGTKTGSCAEEESSVLMQSWQFVPEKPAAHVHV